MGKYRIVVTEKKCTGCLRCQLACSESHTKAFNPSAAHIQVRFSDTECAIGLAAECRACGVCADHCFYGALEKRREAAAK
jgi:Fe-S-cluster-containing hydrogenase component 2